MKKITRLHKQIVSKYFQPTPAVTKEIETDHKGILAGTATLMEGHPPKSKDVKFHIEYSIENQEIIWK